ncbi:T-box transcription factor TBX22-like [Scleropages formosus]|uniref:T-box transcription factor TBX22-like n=1 Tax=Scleropages formosus TaxID=113540 RepID=A0A0P7V497_SCLFO|nr:T-box transcription factor TBX22-like [Scleropages formosus]
MQGLSSRAHAFSVEALVGTAPRKRMKAEQRKEERAAGELVSAEPLDAREAREARACTVLSEEEERDTPGERRRKGSLVQRRATESDSEVDKEVTVELQGSDLWNRFHEIGTEMIITKAGRRMFPSVRVKVKNLDPFKQYYVAMDIMPVDSKRYRYVYHSSQWMVAGNTDHSCIAPRLYVHPDSPCSGETWMRQVISFDRVKLTNNEMDDKGHIILQSMHKYKPRIHIIVHDPHLDLSQIQSLPAEGVHSFSFPETQFTTVTAYQNQQITKLKIDRNPFAKGFRDPGRNRGVLDGILESYPWRTPISVDLKPFSTEPQGGSSGSPLGCGTQPPLKGLLSASCSSPSFPFGVPCSDTLSLSLCYKVSPSASLLGGRHCSFPASPDRLCDYLGWRPMVEHPFLSTLHGKKGPGCRPQHRGTQPSTTVFDHSDIP